MFLVIACLALYIILVLKETCMKKKEAVQNREVDISNILIENVQLSPVVTLSYNTFRPAINKNDSTPILIYRFSFHMCESCIQEDLFELFDFQKQNSKATIYILPAYPKAYPNYRNNQIMLKNMLHNFDFRILPSDSLCIPISVQDEIEKRYFAVINGDKKIEMIFFPRKNYQELTRLYFSEVKKMLKW